MSPSSFTPAVPCPVLPFAPQGPFRSVPLLLRYCGILRVLDVLFFRRFIVFTFRDTATTFPFRSRRGETLPSSDRGYSGYGFPNRVYFAGTSRLPKFLGNPHVHMPCSTTAVDLRTRPYFGLSGFAFRSWNDVGFHNSLFEAQSHGLRTPCLRFAATVTRWLAQNSVPTAGQLCRTGLFTCWVPLQSFSYYTSSLSKLLGALHEGSPSWTISYRPSSRARPGHTAGHYFIILLKR